MQVAIKEKGYTLQVINDKFVTRTFHDKKTNTSFVVFAYLNDYYTRPKDAKSKKHVKALKFKKNIVFKITPKFNGVNQKEYIGKDITKLQKEFFNVYEYNCRTRVRLPLGPLKLKLRIWAYVDFDGREAKYIKR